MKVVVIGATGIIGKEVVRALKSRHEVIEVSRHSQEHRADITNKESLDRLFDSLAEFCAVVSCAGSGSFKPLIELSDEDFQSSLSDKLMGQVNVVRAALPRIAEGGSITITSGVLADEPMVGSAAISLVNGGLESFGKAAAFELAERRIRVNTVSPPWVTESLIAFGMDPSIGMPASEVAKAYVDSVEDAELNGTVIDVRSYR